MMNYIIGCDEVGYGALAGSLCVAGVKAPVDWNLVGLNDSKKLSESKRNIMSEKLHLLINKGEIEWAIAERTNLQIDKVGVATALKDAFVEVFNKLHCTNSQIITDGILSFKDYNLTFPVISIIKADSTVPAVMAASILAKVYRDNMMKELHKTIPMYDWNSNVGYGSKNHLEAIKKFGPCPHHRYSYAPMKNMKIVDKRQLNLFDDV
jgi:ribonuclease HII